MLTDHETRRESDEHDESRAGEGPREHDTQMKFAILEEPTWLDEDPDEEAPTDSPLRGMWIGIAAAAVTFVLVFAIPQWLGWYDIGPPPQARREAAPESVISTVTGQPSSSAVVETGPPALPAVAAPPATAPPVGRPKAAATKEPKETSEVREAKPAPPASASRRLFSVQIAAFKNAKQANQLAARVKRDGYRAEVRRIESSAVPWVVRVGGYTSREEAESARDALARKGLRGFII
ncbi:MAG TPA: SPOR domain-containing protein [Methylomirabilota bacterium]|nr:SPOR domain-containing protein [Methylomirabilota bacterium]